MISRHFNWTYSICDPRPLHSISNLLSFTLCPVSFPLNNCRVFPVCKLNQQLNLFSRYYSTEAATLRTKLLKRVARGTIKPVHAHPNVDVKKAKGFNRVKAICSADYYDIAAIFKLLSKSDSYHVDLLEGTVLRIIHLGLVNKELPDNDNGIDGVHKIEAYVFSEGCIVLWGDELLFEEFIKCMKNVLESSQRGPLDAQESETLSYQRKISQEFRANMLGETIKIDSPLSLKDFEVQGLVEKICDAQVDGDKKFFDLDQHHEADDYDLQRENSCDINKKTMIESLLDDEIKAKVAFSNGLVDSVRLAVLEGRLERHIDRFKEIPQLLAQGKRLPIGRSTVLQMTGELLGFRADLNLHSELRETPDVYWSEPRLEDYYMRVCRCLDIRQRARILNDKLDCANELADVLRLHLSERHSLKLEWGIITLIAVEVLFEVFRMLS